MKTNEDYKKIPGWGMDADLENEPTYPMKNYTGDDHNRINYERSEDVKLHVSEQQIGACPSQAFRPSVSLLL
ncbi:hypothetical protein [Mucilaginibacter sp.]|uniref:hypothetical protein n=1 Tax=Mucilaginibacter sp. TaxID=1882438 RepID=UPI0026321820|nr:hypothetical protein [Mucilaginibacter sp.]MDB4920735.1 hypothetical protein [Mucilaginibacter sp.]